MSPSYYTLQLMGSNEANGIRRFLKENGVNSKYAVYTSVKNNKAWHVIIYGVYESHDFAEQARSDLPDYLKKFSPWIRSIKGVQKSLK